jgi:hypothetical protein
LSDINPSRTLLREALYGGTIQIKPQGFRVASRIICSGCSGGVGPMEVKDRVQSRKATHGPRLFRSHPSAFQIFEGYYSESYAGSFASPMSERQRSVGETTTLLFRAFWATAPAWPHARAFTRTPHTLCDASILAPQALQSFPLWLYAVVAHTVTLQNSTGCEPQASKMARWPPKIPPSLTFRGGAFHVNILKSRDLGAKASSPAIA